MKKFFWEELISLLQQYLIELLRYSIQIWKKFDNTLHLLKKAIYLNNFLMTVWIPQMPLGYRIDLRHVYSQEEDFPEYLYWICPLLPFIFSPFNPLLTLGKHIRFSNFENPQSHHWNSLVFLRQSKIEYWKNSILSTIFHFDSTLDNGYKPFGVRESFGKIFSIDKHFWKRQESHWQSSAYSEKFTLYIENNLSYPFEFAILLQIEEQIRFSHLDCHGE